MFVTTYSNPEEQNDLNYQEGLGFHMCIYFLHSCSKASRYVFVNFSVNSSAE